MTEKDPQHEQPLGGTLIEFESTDRWVAGKTQPELLHDLKIYGARLRDQPRSIPDRLRVAAIQLKLGRTQEALVHYEGVIRGYVADGRVMSAIALCKRIIGYYPKLPRINKILAALYARAPHGSTDAPSPVTPVASVPAPNPGTFVVEDPVDADPLLDENVVVDRVFGDYQSTTPVTRTVPVSPRDLALSRRAGHAAAAGAFPEDRPTLPYAQVERATPEDAPTTIYEDPPREDRNDEDDEEDEDAATRIASAYRMAEPAQAARGTRRSDSPLPLTRMKTASGVLPRPDDPISPVSSSVSVLHEPADGSDEQVVLLTRPKRK